MVWGRPAPFITSHIIGREDKSTNNKTMRPDTKNNGAAGYQCPAKMEGTKSCRSIDGLNLVDIS